MKLVSGALVLVTLIAALGAARKPSFSQTTAMPATKLNGRWQVKFSLAGAEKNLLFDAKARGSGSFLLLDTGLDDKPVPGPLSASWSQLTNNRVSFSGEAELPIGTCCRELGTLIFKGRFSSRNAISGTLIFVTSIDEEESPYRFRSVVGTFMATRVS